MRDRREELADLNYLVRSRGNWVMFEGDHNGLAGQQPRHWGLFAEGAMKNTQAHQMRLMVSFSIGASLLV